MIYFPFAFIGISIIAALYQLTFALNPPLRESTLGGEYSRELPSKIRQDALVQILILVLFNVIVLIRSAVIFEPLFTTGRIAIWFVAGFLVIGSMVALSSSNPKEKWFYGPINILLLALTILIALS